MKSFFLIVFVSVEREHNTVSCRNWNHILSAFYTTILFLEARFLVALNGDLQVVIATKGEKSVFAFNMP